MAKIELTASGGGYYRVYVDGERVSQHTAEREAVESAGDYKRKNPTSEVYYDHDYRVSVELSGTVPSEPEPE